MNYLNQFQKHLSSHDYPAFLALWEEYCLSDEIDDEELKNILEKVKGSLLEEPFGRHVEKGIVLWEKVKETSNKGLIIQLILDIQSTNTAELAEFTLDYLKNYYPDDAQFNDKIRLIGLREQKSFQGAISNYRLLTHMKKGNFVFHTGGWGVGEIMDISFLREELSLEFDYVSGKKDLSFQNAFKTLLPISKDHFLALRFGNPDELEDRAKRNPVEIIRTLLRDLGPKTAAEIKEELYELVIPTEDWARWWQVARTKVKKDTLIDTPSDVRTPFHLRKAEVSHEDRLQKALEKKPDANTLIQMVYSFLRDFPQTIKNQTFKSQLEDKLHQALSLEGLTQPQALQIHFFLEDLSQGSSYTPISTLIKELSSIEAVIGTIEIIAFKKRLLLQVHAFRQDWSDIFINLLLAAEQNLLRDYILTELLKAGKKKAVTAKLEELLSFPNRYPYALLWYFQKIMRGNDLPFADQEGKNRFFESFLILFSLIEQSIGYRDLIKKMHLFLTTGRYSNVRKIFQSAGKETVQEFLLLATKCHSLNDHDIKILHSLAEVVHPSLRKLNKKYNEEEEELPPIWTTKEGYNKIKERIHRISTIETVENAKEIEAAREHGDLRENAEFKAALERRDRLQNELKLLSSQFSRARILTPDDVSTQAVGIGVIIDCENSKGETVSYTLLGPWEADPDRNILSFQSKLAQSLMGEKIGSKVAVQGQQLTIRGLRNYFHEH